MKTFLRRLRNEEDGQDLVEYALLAALIALLAVAALGPLADALTSFFTSLATALSSASGA